MTPEATPGVALITPRVGGGKDVFKESIKPHLVDLGLRVDDLDPSTVGLAQKAVWNGLVRPLYSESSKNKLVAWFYGRAHTGSNPLRDALVSWAGEDLMKQAQDLGDLPLTLHGLIGRNWLRWFAEGDVIPEPSAAYPLTQSFVPLDENVGQLLRYNVDIPEPHVAGFIVPQEVKNKKRREERKEAFEAEAPKRLAFLTSGQLADVHFNRLYKEVFSDLHADIKHKGLKVDVYTWKSESKAREVEKMAQEKRLKVRVSHKYDPDDDYDYDVQIYCHKDSDMATRLSFQIAENADVIMTPLGERMPWSAYAPIVSMEPIAGNVKMIANYYWALDRGIILPSSLSAREQLALYAQKGVIRRHYEKTDNVFSGDKKLNGAENIARAMKEFSDKWVEALR